MSVRNWSTTASSNNSAPPYGAPEGQAPSSINNVIRQIMADARDTFEALPYFDFGHTPTRVDGDTFTVATDLTATYTVGRQLKFVGATTEYAIVTSSSYSAPNTTVNVSGTVPTSLSTVSICITAQPEYRRTAAEIAEGVTPTNYGYLPGHLQRYGAVGDYTTDDSTAIQNCVNVCIAGGYEMTGNEGVYRHATQITVDGPLRIRSPSPAGPRVYTSSTAYGGIEFIYDAAVVVGNRETSGNYGWVLDTGTVGAEGYARIRLEGIGIGWTDKDAGGIYCEGAVDIGVFDCWLTGGNTNYATATGFAMYIKDAIVSHIERNTFSYVAFGIVGESYINEDVIERNDFVNVSDTCVLLRGKTATSIRSTISRNNITTAKYGFVIAGDSRDVTIAENTLEIVTHGPIIVTATDPIDASSNGTPTNLLICGNTFIATNGGVSSDAINLSAVTTAVVFGNSLKSPTVGVSSMINVGSSCSNVSIFGNDPDTKTLIGGDPTKCAILDAKLFRTLPRDTSEATKSGWTSDNAGALWYHTTNNVLRMRVADRIGNIGVTGTATAADGDTTPSVKGINSLLCNYSGIATITTFDDGYDGQIISVYNQSASNLTISSASIGLQGSSNFVMAQNACLQLQQISGSWIEVGRRTP